MSLRTSFKSACDFVSNLLKEQVSLPRCIQYDPRHDDARVKIETSCPLHYELRSFAVGDRHFLRVRLEGEAVAKPVPSSGGYLSVITVSQIHGVPLGSFSANKAEQKFHDFNHGYPLSHILKDIEIEDPLLKKIIKAEETVCYMQQLPGGRYDIFPEDKNEAGRCTRLRDFGALTI